ncbi:hypothetical protein GCM10028786_31460 [Flaviaesturariibacter terrae]
MRYGAFEYGSLVPEKAAAKAEEMTSVEFNGHKSPGRYPSQKPPVYDPVPAVRN